MEIEKRTNGFDYPERNNAKSVNGKQDPTSDRDPARTHAHIQTPSDLLYNTVLLLLDHTFPRLHSRDEGLGCTSFDEPLINASITACTSLLQAHSHVSKPDTPADA